MNKGLLLSLALLIALFANSQAEFTRLPKEAYARGPAITDGRAVPVITEAVAAAQSDLDQAKTDLGHAKQTAALNLQQAHEKKVATRDKHQAQITELQKQHAQEQSDLLKAQHDQEQTDTKTIQEKEIEVIRTQALSDAMSRKGQLGKRGEHWGPGAVTGEKETFDVDN